MKIVFYDVTGREVKTLLDQRQHAGHHSINWNGCGNAGNLLTSGIYFYRLKAGNFIQTKKMMFVQ